MELKDQTPLLGLVNIAIALNIEIDDVLKENILKLLKNRVGIELYYQGNTVSEINKKNVKKLNNVSSIT